VRRSRSPLWDRDRRQRSFQPQEERDVDKAEEAEPVAAQVAALQPRIFLNHQQR
jgi:hypothetical protein